MRETVSLETRAKAIQWLAKHFAQLNTEDGRNVWLAVGVLMGYVESVDEGPSLEAVRRALR